MLFDPLWIVYDLDQNLCCPESESVVLLQLWIHAAKAIRADYEGKRSLQAFHLLKSHSWNASHEVVLKHLAAKAIVNGN